MRHQPVSPWLAALLVTQLGAGCAADVDTRRTGTDSDRIIGGTVHSGDPAVVYLTTDGSFMCTGSLIAPRVVLTARHCIEDTDTGMRTAASSLGVGTGPNAETGTAYASVLHVETTTGAWEGQDIAVLLLDREGTLVPYDWARTAPATGVEIVGIGYGQTEGSAPGSSSAGIKYRGTSTVGMVDAAELTTSGTLSCYGDSGGPGFIGGVVAGVVSRGTADTCEGGSTIYTRVDAFASLIETVMGMADGTIPIPPPGTTMPGGTPCGDSDGDGVDDCAGGTMPGAMPCGDGDGDGVDDCSGECGDWDGDGADDCAGPTMPGGPGPGGGAPCGDGDGDGVDDCSGECGDWDGDGADDCAGPTMPGGPGPGGGAPCGDGDGDGVDDCSGECGDFDGDGWDDCADSGPYPPGCGDWDGDGWDDCAY